MKAFLIRHGTTDWNLEKRVQGREDIALNETGREQARYCAGCLKEVPFDCIIASPLSRARETAEILAGFHPEAEFCVMDAFIERDFGEYSGQPFAMLEIMRQRESLGEAAIESKEAVAARALAGLTELAGKYPDGAVCVVTHGGVINSVLGRLSDYRLRHLFLDNVSVTGLKEENGRFSILDYNVLPEHFLRLWEREKEWNEDTE